MREHSKFKRNRKRITRRLGWVAYGLAPRWLAALMATLSVAHEFDAATAAQLAELAQQP